MVYIIGEAGPSDPRRQPLATKRGTPIPNTRRLPQPSAAIDAAAEKIVSEYNAYPRSKSSDYNCVGMALASRRTFIDIEHLRMILEEDGYRQVGAPEVVPGDLAIYSYGGEFAHVGVVVKHQPDVANADWNTLVLSQWGTFGEYFHDLRKISMSHGELSGFWSERLT
jgi:hypothetical protein